MFIKQNKSNASSRDAEYFIHSEAVIQRFLDMQKDFGLEHVVLDDDLRRMARELGISV